MTDLARPGQADGADGADGEPRSPRPPGSPAAGTRRVWTPSHALPHERSRRPRRLGVRVGGATLLAIALACLAAPALPGVSTGSTMGQVFTAGRRDLALLAIVVTLAFVGGILVGALAHASAVARVVARAGTYSLSTLPLLVVVVLVMAWGDSTPWMPIALGALGSLPVAVAVHRDAGRVMVASHARWARSAGATGRHLFKVHLLPAIRRPALAGAVTTTAVVFALVSSAAFVVGGPHWGGLLREVPGGTALGPSDGAAFWGPTLAIAATMASLVALAWGLATSQTRRSGEADGEPGLLDVVVASANPARGQTVAVLGLAREETDRLRPGCRPADPDVALLTTDPAALRSGRTVGAGFREYLVRRRICSKAEAPERIRAALAAAGDPDPEGCASAYPRDLDRHRAAGVLLAIAMSARPHTLVVVEPTATLGVTAANALVERAIGMCGGDTGMILVDGDVGTAARHADRVTVLHERRIVEEGTASDVLEHPSAPSTAQLLAAAPDLTGAASRTPCAESRQGR